MAPLIAPILAQYFMASPVSIAEHNTGTVMREIKLINIAQHFRGQHCLHNQTQQRSIFNRTQN